MLTSAAHMREYETIYVLKPELEDAAAIAFIEKMRGLVEREGGKHLKITNWGRRKLAWERQKQQKGMYVHHRYLGKPGIVAEYERNLAIEENVMLRQTVLVDPAVDPSSRQPEEDVLQPPVQKETKREEGRRGYDDDEGYGGYGDRGDRYGDRYEGRGYGDRFGADRDVPEEEETDRE